MSVLDIGCGVKGGYGSPLEGENVIHADLDKKAFCLEMVCGIQNLPFRSGAFNIIHASHILEHIANPSKAVEELNRVAKRWAIIKVPNATHYKATPESPEHIYSWNEYTLTNLLKRRFKTVKVFPSDKAMPKRFWGKLRVLKKVLLSLMLGPNELTAVARVEPKN